MENLLIKTMVSRGTRHSLATKGRRWAENSQILLVCITQEHKVQTTNWPGEVIKKKTSVSLFLCLKLRHSTPFNSYFVMQGQDYLCATLYLWEQWWICSWTKAPNILVLQNPILVHCEHNPWQKQVKILNLQQNCCNIYQWQTQRCASFHLNKKDVNLPRHLVTCIQ